MHLLPMGSIGGAENFVLSLCQHHDRSRFDIHVCILFGGETIAREIIKTGVTLHRLYMRNGFDFCRAARLFWIIKANAIDIVNIHGQNPLGKLFSIVSRAPLIIHTDHGITVGSPIRRKKRVVLFNRLIRSFIHEYIAISKNMSRSLQIREKVDAERITLIYNAIDVNAFNTVMAGSPAEMNQDANKKVIFGTIGRLVGEKRFHLLIEAARLLKELISDFEIIIIGHGPERVRLVNQIATAGLVNHVHLLGERKDIRELLHTFDVFVFPSGGEAFSITILEAMACSKAILAFDVEGVNEAVVDNETGFLVPEGNLGQFVEKMYILKKCESLREKMGLNGYAKVLADFNMVRKIKEIESFYIHSASKMKNRKYMI